MKMPFELHEFSNRLLVYIVRMLAVALSLLCADVGLMTFQRGDLEKGAELDTGFHVRNAIPRKETASRVPNNLPSDLLVKVDITSPFTRWMSIYCALGTAEVWQYIKRKSECNSVVIHRLVKNDYAEAVVSLAFANLTTVQLNQFLSDYQNDIQLTRDIHS